jgi:hypothetical protein
MANRHGGKNVRAEDAQSILNSMLRGDGRSSAVSG